MRTLGDTLSEQAWGMKNGFVWIKRKYKEANTDGANLHWICCVNKRKWNPDIPDCIPVLWLEDDLDKMGLDMYLARRGISLESRNVLVIILIS